MSWRVTYLVRVCEKGVILMTSVFRMTLGIRILHTADCFNCCIQHKFNVALSCQPQYIFFFYYLKDSFIDEIKYSVSNYTLKGTRLK